MGTLSRLSVPDVGAAFFWSLSGDGVARLRGSVDLGCLLLAPGTVVPLNKFCNSSRSGKLACVLLSPKLRLSTTSLATSRKLKEMWAM